MAEQNNPPFPSPDISEQSFTLLAESIYGGQDKVPWWVNEGIKNGSLKGETDLQRQATLLQAFRVVKNNQDRLPEETQKAVASALQENDLIDAQTQSAAGTTEKVTSYNPRTGQYTVEIIQKDGTKTTEERNFGPASATLLQALKHLAENNISEAKELWEKENFGRRLVFAQGSDGAISVVMVTREPRASAQILEAASQLVGDLILRAKEQGFTKDAELFRSLILTFAVVQNNNLNDGIRMQILNDFLEKVVASKPLDFSINPLDQLAPQKETIAGLLVEARLAQAAASGQNPVAAWLAAEIAQVSAFQYEGISSGPNRESEIRTKLVETGVSGLDLLLSLEQAGFSLVQLESANRIVRRFQGPKSNNPVIQSLAKASPDTIFRLVRTILPQGNLSDPNNPFIQGLAKITGQNYQEFQNELDRKTQESPNIAQTALEVLPWFLLVSGIILPLLDQEERQQ